MYTYLNEEAILDFDQGPYMYVFSMLDCNTFLLFPDFSFPRNVSIPMEITLSYCRSSRTDHQLVYDIYMIYQQQFREYILKVSIHVHGSCNKKHRLPTITSNYISNHHQQPSTIYQKIYQQSSTMFNIINMHVHVSPMRIQCMRNLIINNSSH